MLKINNIFKKYKDKKVLKGVSFDIAENEIKGLIGVNGAGKSTLIEIICGLKNFDSGDIFIDGININNKKNKKYIKNIIGYMPQRFNLFNDLTVKENLGYLCAVYGLNENIIEDIMSQCFLTEHKNVLAKNLSGGYKQLLSMAGALIHSPKILILDEPTASMDPIFRRKFWQVLNKRQDLTILVITHYIEELIECDNFVCLSGGKISFSGSLNEYKQDGLLNIEELLNKYTIEG